VTVSITPAKVAAAQGSIAAGALRKVAVIDSGDLPGGANMVDFLGPATPPPSYTLTDDDHGHGSAISQLIRDLRPSVSIEAVRIVDSAGVADSFDLFLALVYSMWPGTFEIVNVSLTQDILGQCETWLGATLTFILEQCRNSGKGSNALLVAAAGNDPNVEAQYPALLPDAIVATASDWSGVSASYNSTTIAAARSGTIVQAYGGLPTDPFGTWTDRAGAQHAMWGTSFAAAVVTASYLS
jgi:hypothetical protein